VNLTPIFNHYLRHAQIPRLELLFGEAPGMVMHKWSADEKDFSMPVRVGSPDHWQIIHRNKALAGDADFAEYRQVRGGNRSLLRRHKQAIAGELLSRRKLFEPFYSRQNGGHAGYNLP
jgi:hypothetical protein